MFKLSRGFTLIEILLVIGLIAILAAIVIIAINPARQFAQARNTQRFSDVNAILNAVHQNMIDNRGSWDDSDCAGDIPTTTATKMGTGGGDYDIYGCLVDLYLPAMPYDPVDGSFTSSSTYDTGYEIIASYPGGRITISAPSSELEVTISVTR